MADDAHEGVAPLPARDDRGAGDRTRLRQRVHDIVHRFCASHLHDELGRAPVRPAQLASVGRGVVPEGEP